MRKLKPEEIECRVAQVKESGCSLLLYKTARVDRAILDEEFGTFGWQNDFKLINGNMYGGIGIKHGDEWIWRWDCGTPNKTEIEKSEASDCFKRAGFKWGIGVELYSTPFIWINAETYLADKVKKVYKLKNAFEKFTVKDIKYSDNGDICDLVIINSKNDVVYSLNKKQALKQVKPKVSDDTDIYEGLNACDTAKNAKAYYKQYESKVNNVENFKQAYLKVWNELKAKEAKIA